MRIAFVVNNYPPRVGGVEQHVASLAHHLVEQGHEVCVFTLGDGPSRSVEDGVVVMRFREHLRVGDVLGFCSPLAAVRIWRSLRDLHVDVISVHTRFFPLSWLGALCGRALRVPVIYTEHGGGHVVSDSPVITGASRAVDATAGRMVARSATRALGVSEAVVDFVQRFSGRKAEVFHNAIDLAPSPPVPVVTRPLHYVFVGRLVPGKGWETFVDLVAHLRALGHPVTAEVLGDGPDTDALRARVAERGCADAVVIRGRVGREDVRAALSGATLVNPTVLAEGFQTTLLEAVAEDASVLTYPVPGAQVLADQGAPVLVCADRTLSALSASALDLLAHPRPPVPESVKVAWAWPARAQDYARICEEAAAR